MADLGNLDNFLKEGGVSNLDWLDVDEQEYRKQDRLPEQNLQISPDLEALWSHEDKPATSYLEPNQAAVPRTMGDLSKTHGALRAKPAEIVRVVKLALLQTTDPARVEDALVKRFDRDSLTAASQEILATMEERGLLGRFYVDASDFQGCASGKGLELVTKHASNAPFVLAKAACRDCAHSQQVAGKSHCSQFHKQLVIELPYTEALAEKVASRLKAAGRDIKDQPNLTARERIREAFLAPAIKIAPPAAMPKPIENTARLMSQASTPAPLAVTVDLTAPKQAAREAVDTSLKSGRLKVTDAQGLFKEIAAATTLEHVQALKTAAEEGVPVERVVYRGAGIQAPPAVATPEAAQAGVEKAAQEAAKAQEAADKLAAKRRAAPVIALLRREMLKGRGPKELVTALRLAFDVRDLGESKPLWEPVFREAGLFGVVYASQESFGDCREGADFLARHNPGIRVLVAGAKCSGCIYNKIGRCLLYGKPLVQSASEILTPETVTTVIQEHRTAGRLSPVYSVPMQMTPAAALRTIHAAVEQHRTSSVQASERLNVQTAFHGQPVGQVTSGITRREIVRTASRYINEGLYGNQLREAMLARFDPRDLIAAKDDLKPVLAEQGLQGIYYVDPTIYADYGHGCEEAMRLHRSRLVANVKPGPKCSSCILQTKPGYCSKLNKTLGEPYYADKAAQQKAILSSGPATEISYDGLVNNGHAMLQEFEMSQREAEVVIDEPQKPIDVTIEFGNQGIKL